MSFTDREKVILAALWHDIGKLEKRGNKHGAHTETIVQRIFGDQEIVNMVESKDSALGKIVKRADWVASGIDRGPASSSEVELNNVQKSLSTVRLPDDNSPHKPSYHRLVPLWSSNYAIEGATKVDRSVTDIRMRRILKLIQAFMARDVGDPIERSIRVLERTTWSITASPRLHDVSIFDHSRLCATLAVCIYDYELEYACDFKEKECYNPEPDQLRYLLVKGDIRGVQEFIYSIIHRDGGAHAKQLRARSFFVNMLTEDIVSHIISELKLPRVNILYSGGGDFLLLLPNTDTAHSMLSETQSYANGVLRERFGGVLGLTLSKVECRDGCSDLRNRIKCSGCKDSCIRGFDRYLKMLNEQMESDKNKPLAGDDEDQAFDIPDDESIWVCPWCHILTKSNESAENCIECAQQIAVGGDLPKTRYIGFAKEGVQLQSRAHFNLVYRSVHLFSESPSVTETDVELKTLGLERRGDVFLNQDAMYVACGIPTALEDLSTDTAVIEKGQVLDFNTLAHLAEGDKKLGVLALDVDCLGLIFEKGLKTNDHTTIGRIAFASRSLEFFFGEHVATVAKDLARSDESRRTADMNIYLLYTGGDDLVAIGPWNDIIRFGIDVQDSFARYSGRNPSVTCSGGISICHPKLPVKLAVLQAQKALSKAKEKGNSVSVFGQVLPWTASGERGPCFVGAVEVAERIVKALSSNLLSRSLVRGLLDLHKQYVAETAIYIGYVPRLLYQITRNVNDDKEEGRDLVAFLKQKIIAENLFRYAPVIGGWALLKTRDRSGENGWQEKGRT